jgi:hypothetical protein
MHIMSKGECAAASRVRAFYLEYKLILKIAVCCEIHPTLGVEPQNILTDGM